MRKRIIELANFTALMIIAILGALFIPDKNMLNLLINNFKKYKL